MFPPARLKPELSTFREMLGGLDSIETLQRVRCSYISVTMTKLAGPPNYMWHTLCKAWTFRGRARHSYP